MGKSEKPSTHGFPLVAVAVLPLCRYVSRFNHHTIAEICPKRAMSSSSCESSLQAILIFVM